VGSGAAVISICLAELSGIHSFFLNGMVTGSKGIGSSFIRGIRADQSCAQGIAVERKKYWLPRKGGPTKGSGGYRLIADDKRWNSGSTGEWMPGWMASIPYLLRGLVQ
jgi:hypothetical protein